VEKKGILSDVDLEGLGGPPASSLDDFWEGACGG
jgi:hypothetical protein